MQPLPRTSSTHNTDAHSGSGGWARHGESRLRLHTRISRASHISHSRLASRGAALATSRRAAPHRVFASSPTRLGSARSAGGSPFASSVSICAPGLPCTPPLLPQWRRHCTALHWLSLWSHHITCSRSPHEPHGKLAVPQFSFFALAKTTCTCISPFRATLARCLDFSLG